MEAQGGDFEEAVFSLTNVACTRRLRVQSNPVEPLMKYTVILEREADGGFVVTVPVLPGCVSQGDTREEAMANIREAIEVYLEDCREVGARFRRKTPLNTWSFVPAPDR
jgi:predicted RNase H-like HicB family nuclease